MKAPSPERMALLDPEELDALRGWVDNQRADPSLNAEDRDQSREARRRLLERIEQARKQYV